MAEITAALVKELRERSGAGMMDCKKALTESAGDIEAAVDWLRKKGLAAAAKKAGRVAAEGLVALEVAGGKGAIVEVNAETDFVGRSDKFQDFVRNVAKIAQAKSGDLEGIASAAYPGTGRTVSEELTQLIATIGENMNLRRSAALAAEPGVIASYMHNAIGANLGKIGVLVALKSTGDKTKLAELGRQIAMHVAAANPQAVTVKALDQASIERERSVLSEQARASGKPEEIIAKMVEGRLRKFYEEVVLLEQIFVIDGETKVGKVVEAAATAAGAPIEVTGFVRFALGEGIERNQGDFAAEVAQLAR
jgi:elongation factor Ts